MSSIRPADKTETEESVYLFSPHLPAHSKKEDGTPRLNRWSHFITRGHDYPASKAMLYGAGVPNENAMANYPHVGIASVWWEGNPCNMHLFDMGRAVKQAVDNREMLGWQYNTIGVSDAITMGNEGMRYSLQSREIIADSIETLSAAQKHDAVIALPGCDKNMPGCIMAAARLNRPFIMIYGGTIKRGRSETMRMTTNVTTCFEMHGAYIYDTLKEPEDGEHQGSGGKKKKTKDEILDEVERHACPGAGACAGMYTANTMATAIESMGLSLPGSSSTPAESPAKMRECAKAAEAIKVCMERDIKARDLITRRSFENALVMLMALGGSTNAVLHFLAMARSADVELSLDDIQRASDKIPYIANLKPSGKYLMEDLYEIGGIPSVQKLLVAAGLLDGGIMTVTGKTLAENIESWPSLPQDQTLIQPLSNPIKANGHIQILYGNLAPDGAVSKITGKEGLVFTGKARCYDKEEQLNKALLQGDITNDENEVLIVRYEGPKGGPGMPEQLRASAMIMGAGLTRKSLVTDGRYSGASHGFIVGHVCPEAAVGGPIALVRDGDMVTIDAESNVIQMDHVSEEELARRRAEWKPPRKVPTRGTLAKYAALVGDASHGAMTDIF